MKNKYLLYPLFFLLIMTSKTYSQCFDDGHSPFQNDGWFSCSTSIGPVPERGDAHWILYDFGEEYAIDSLYFWNHNVWGETEMGVKDILIDFSSDKESWTTVGPIAIEEAPGSWKYTGSNGPSLNNKKMRYLLITVISTWDEDISCAGLGEVRFQIGEPTAIEEEKQIAWNIYPNPATSQISLTIEDHEVVQKIVMFDALGRKMADLPLPSGNEIIYPIEELNTGLYYLTIYSEKGISTASFVKN